MIFPLTKLTKFSSDSSKQSILKKTVKKVNKKKKVQKMIHVVLSQLLLSHQTVVLIGWFLRHSLKEQLHKLKEKKNKLL